MSKFTFKKGIANFQEVALRILALIITNYFYPKECNAFVITARWSVFVPLELLRYYSTSQVACRVFN